MNVEEVNKMGKIPMPAYMMKFCTELNTHSVCIYQMASFWQGNHVFNVSEEIWAFSSFSVRMKTVLFEINTRTLNTQRI